ncbi:hypothetical protein HYX09_03370 [Candidatus Woesearchaeota archaeon]|nr:hypothetical protein [Candidatus Woesearchaeota archaeon]MBI2661282.1 hypothetical protein [Candidatus Woesearchaeota archaeon]
MASGYFYRSGDVIYKFPARPEPFGGNIRHEGLFLTTKGGGQRKIELDGMSFDRTPRTMARSFGGFIQLDENDPEHTGVFPAVVEALGGKAENRTPFPRGPGQDDQSVESEAYADYTAGVNDLLMQWHNLEGQHPLSSELAGWYSSRAFNGPHLWKLEQISGESPLVDEARPIIAENHIVTYAAREPFARAIHYKIHFYSPGAASHFVRDVARGTYGPKNWLNVSDNLFMSGLVRTGDGQMVECGEWDDKRGAYDFLTIGARNGSDSYLHLAPDTPAQYFVEVVKGLANEEFDHGAGLLRVAQKTGLEAVIDAFVEHLDVPDGFKFPVRKAA